MAASAQCDGARLQCPARRHIGFALELEIGRQLFDEGLDFLRRVETREHAVLGRRQQRPQRVAVGMGGHGRRNLDGSRAWRARASGNSTGLRVLPWAAEQGNCFIRMGQGQDVSPYIPSSYCDSPEQVSMEDHAAIVAALDPILPLMLRGAKRANASAISPSALASSRQPITAAISTHTWVLAPLRRKTCQRGQLTARPNVSVVDVLAIKQNQYNNCENAGEALPKQQRVALHERLRRRLDIVLVGMAQIEHKLG